MNLLIAKTFPSIYITTYGVIDDFSSRPDFNLNMNRFGLERDHGSVWCCRRNHKTSIREKDILFSLGEGINTDEKLSAKPVMMITAVALPASAAVEVVKRALYPQVPVFWKLSGSFYELSVEEQ